MEIEQKVCKLFSSFIRDLCKPFPELKNNLYRNYESEITEEDLKLNDCPKIKCFLSKIDKYNKFITDKDEKLFDIEEELLEGICFKKLWEKNISDKTKATIWKYLQTFIIININLNSSEQLQDALSTMSKDQPINVKDKETIENLKKLKKLTKDVKAKEETELEDMLSGLMGSNIGSIAKEVASSMDIEGMFGNVNQDSNPMDLMSQMMGSEKMGDIFKNINSVMEGKMKSGELNEETLKKEARDMYGNMAGNPLFGNLMGQMNQGDPNDPAKEDKPKKLTKEEKSEILKQKIEAKKNERTK